MFKYKHIKYIAAIVIMAVIHVADAADATSQGMFDSVLSNHTPMHSINNAKRGGFSGPSYYGRHPQSSYLPPVVTWVPPSFKVGPGCTGIDATMGAFSHIQPQALITAVRKVASQALPYAFSLALAALCTSCDQKMQQLQAIAQQINEQNIKSCEAAKYLVDQIPYKKEAEDSLGQLGNGVAGFFKDNNESKQELAKVEGGGKAPSKQMLDAGGAAAAAASFKEVNTAYQVLKITNAGLWFNPRPGSPAASAVGQQATLELFMNLVGTIITSFPEDTSDISGIATRVVEPTIGLHAFLEGGDKLPLFRCNGEPIKCLHPKTPPASTDPVKGFNTIIREILYGTAPGTGILNKVKSKTVPLTSDEQRFISFMPLSLYGTLVRLSPNREMMEFYADSVTAYVGLQMASHMLDTVIAGARVASQKHTEDKAIGRWVESLRTRKAELNTEMNLQLQAISGINSVLSVRTTLINALKDNGR